MNPRFFFVGHETVGAHVARCLADLGWERADDVAQADVAFSYCTSSSALEDAYFDGEGLVKRARPGTLLVDLSPTSPSFARELSAVATVNDLRPIEAPLSVIDPSVPDAFESPANLMCFAAGEPDDVELILPQLESVMHLLEVIAVIGGAEKAPAALALMYREEADSAAHGLDWTRAEDLFSDHDDHCHDHDCDHDHGYDDDDGFGMYGGLGGYSAN